MQLNKLSVTNFRLFEQIEFSFDKGMNLIVGANGSGKSSLLSAISVALDESVRALSGDIGLSNPISEGDVRFEMEIIGTRVRFERRFPAKLKATCTLEGKTLECEEGRVSSENTLSGPHSPLHRELDKKARELGKISSTTLPFFACYGPKRNTESSPPSLERAASEQVSRRNGYKNWTRALTDTEELQTWVVAKTLERLQIISEEGRESPLLVGDELEVVNSVLQGLLPNLAGLRFDIKLKTMLLEFQDGRLLPFMSLSDGQKGLIALLADICRRMVIINPHLGVLAAKQTPGILMVDELDIHLHPGWQRLILRSLMGRFPLLQIFATSHSPQMIGGLAPNQVVLLRGGKMLRPEVTYGLDASRVLEDVMDVDAKEEEVENEISLIFQDIENRNLDSARDRLRGLKTKAPKLPEYVRAEALIRRMEIVGR